MQMSLLCKGLITVSCMLHDCLDNFLPCLPHAGIEFYILQKCLQEQHLHFCSKLRYYDGKLDLALQCTTVTKCILKKTLLIKYYFKVV